MIVEIKMFAVGRQLAGQDVCRVEVGEGATIADVREALLESVPELKPMAAQLRLAMDAQYATDATPIESGAEIALIPPVSGG